MVTAFNLVYSAAAVYRLVGNAFPVVRVEKWWKVVLVVFKGCRARFMSRRAFLEHFVLWRKAQAKALQVIRHPDFSYSFNVKNEAKGSSYQVQIHVGGLVCNCEDFQNQSQFFGRACCKHGYAVLSFLGYETLGDYIEKRKA